MRAILRDLGIIDSRNDILTISMIRGTKSAMHSTGQIGLGVGSWPSNRMTRDRLPSELDYTS